MVDLDISGAVFLPVDNMKNVLLDLDSSGTADDIDVAGVMGSDT